MKIRLFPKKFRVLLLVLIVLMTALTGVSSGAVTEYWLEAKAFTKIMPDGVPITMWGFGSCGTSFSACGPATVPGPQLTVPLGQSLSVHVKNSLTGPYVEPVSLVIPGLIADSMTPQKFTDAQGRQRVRSFTVEAAAGGGTAVYNWSNIVPGPGTLLYQSGTHPSVQVQMGLYGAATIDSSPTQTYLPTSANPNTTYTNAVVLLYSEIDSALHNAIATGNYGPNPPNPVPPGWLTSTIDYGPQYFLINGDPFAPGMSQAFSGNPGDTVELRFLNAGLQTHVPVLQGPYMTLIAEDGSLLPYPKNQYSLMLPAGKTMDVIITLPPIAGYLPLYDRVLDLTNGAATPGGMLTYLKVVAATQYALTVNKTGSTGSGRIMAASLPGGIDCGSDCSESYNSGTAVRLSPIPDPGSSFSNWSGACAGSGPCIVTMDAAKTVTAIFLLSSTYTVTPSAGPNGGMTPSVPQTVNINNTASFLVTPNTGYHIASVSGCGGTPVGPQANDATYNYTTGPITANCTVAATFEINTYTVTPSAGPNGGMTPSISQTVNYNSTPSFLVTPNTGYHIASVSGCGGTPVGPQANDATYNYTTGPITANCTVAAAFEINTYTVTPSAGPNGSLSPSTPQTVNYNSNAVFSVLPNAGYQINAVTGCGGTRAGNTYTTGPIAAACTVSATFKPGIRVSVPNGGESWQVGTTQVIRWTYSGTPGSLVRIELLKGGLLNRTITSSRSVGSGGNGFFNWTIPSNQTPGNDYVIRVTSTTNGAYTDTSNANFTITGPPPPSITVTVPNGGETWTRNSVRTIRWTYTGNPGSLVRIELLKGGVLNRTIASGVSRGTGGNGSFNWSIPSNQTTGNDFTIRIRSTTNAAATDTSNANFTIGP